MRRWPIEELIQHPQSEALQHHFDERNQIWLRRLMWVFGLFGVAQTLAVLARGSWPELPGPALNLLALGGVFWLLRSPEPRIAFRRLLMAYLVGQYFLLLLYDSEGAGVVANWSALFLILMLFFRLKTEAYLVLVAVFWGTALGVGILGPRLGHEEAELESEIGFTLFTCFCLAVAILLTRQYHKRFLTRWRRERLRHKEGMRMREELEAARRIQLQMLPEGDEIAPWLDVASISLPATEVGGDYYDYFRLSEDQVAVVVGDVAGHGVRSGILLSGVRSCLHLLHGYEEAPSGIMQKLDEVVRQTTDHRMFMTLQYVIFDHASRAFTLASAGHIPMLHYSRERGEVSEVAAATLPLGTALRSRYGTERLPFGEGDAFAFYTDGISELVDTRGRVYDSERLHARLAETASDGRSAEAIRDALLDDLWDFQGDAPQRDDLTLVVVRPLP